MTQNLSADFSRRKFWMTKVASGLAPTTFEQLSPVKGNATKFVINHSPKPVAWMILEHTHGKRECSKNLLSLRERFANQALSKVNLKTKKLKPSKPVANKTAMFHNTPLIIIAFFAISSFPSLHTSSRQHNNIPLNPKTILFPFISPTKSSQPYNVLLPSLSPSRDTNQ